MYSLTTVFASLVFYLAAKALLSAAIAPVDMSYDVAPTAQEYIQGFPR